MLRSCTLVSSPITISSSSPRSTLPYHTLERAPIRTIPTTTAAGATKASSATRGRWPSISPKSGSCKAELPSPLVQKLPALPDGLTLLQEGRYTLAEVPAAVGLDDQVLGVGQVGERQSAEGFLGDAHCDWGVGLQARAQLAHPVVEFVSRDDLRRQPYRQGLLGGERPRGVDQLLGAGGPDQGHEPRVVLHGEAVA